MSAHFWGKRIFLQFSYILIKGLSSQIASYFYLIHILLALGARAKNLKNQTVVDTENLKEKFMFPLSVFLTCNIYHLVFIQLEIKLANCI